jgi:hypothetical protein
MQWITVLLAYFPEVGIYDIGGKAIRKETTRKTRA